MAEKVQDENVDDEGQEEGVEQEGAQGGAEGEGEPLLKADGTPFTRADLDALQTALSKARKDARMAARGGGRKPAEKAEGDAEKVAADAATAAAAKFKPMVVKSAARGAFVEAGLVLPKDGQDAAMARALRLLDLDDIDVDDDGQVDGLREQIEDIRRDFPELFTTTRKHAPRVDAAGRPAAGSATKTSAERLAGQLLGGGR